MKKFKSKVLYCVVRTNKFGNVLSKWVFDDQKIAVRECRSLQQLVKDMGFCCYIVPFTVPVYYFK